MSRAPVLAASALAASILTACAAAPPSTFAADLASTATRFLERLDVAQRRLAWRPIDHEEALRWNFVPGRYVGIELGAMTPAQRRAACDLLRTMLSATGFAKTMAILDLENVLRAVEADGGRAPAHRDPGRYALLICGDCSPGGTFVVRFQGHHVSLRCAVVDGVFAGHTPHFLGSNPHRVPRAWARPAVLAGEEELARELMASFTERQLDTVVIAAEAPRDVLLGPGRPPAALGERRGLPWSAMSEGQRAKLWRLLEHHARVLRGDLAQRELRRIRERDLDELSFAWAGPTDRGKGHYYRVHGTAFAIEYDCTQDDANHVHVVWRDFDRDFGGDALRRHLRARHGR